MSTDETESTPEQLAADMAAFDPARPDADVEMKRIIAAAEAGGEEHMIAVIDALPPPPTGPLPPAPDDVLVDPKTRRARFRSDDLNITMSLVLNVDGRQWEARETVDPFVWDVRLARDTDERERYFAYFIRKAVGGLADDPAVFEYLRRKLFVVRPSDHHDARLCRTSNNPNQNQYLWLRCLNGLIHKALSLTVPDWVTSNSNVVRDVLGACSCRCHRGRYGQQPTPPPGLALYDDRDFVPERLDGVVPPA